MLQSAHSHTCTYFAFVTGRGVESGNKATESLGACLQLTSALVQIVRSDMNFFIELDIVCIGTCMYVQCIYMYMGL